MSELKDTWNRHAGDLVAGNMAGLMGDFTPAGMAKAMVLATNPITATTFEINDLGNNEAVITYVGSVRRPVWSKWEETSPGKWQITDVGERPE
jgi:hypothetical protein